MGLSFRAIASLVLLVSFTTGCATYDNMKAPPAQSQPIAVEFTSPELSGWALPVGVYIMPNSQTVISGNSGPPLGVAFGAIGILAQDAIGSSVTKENVGGMEGALRIDVTEQSRAIARAMIDSGRFGKLFTTLADPGASILTVSAYLVVSYLDDANVRPYVVLNAKLLNAKGTAPVWASRYTASLGKAMPLAGENGLAANGGEPLRRMVSADVEIAVRAMLSDVTEPRARAGNEMTLVQSWVPYLKKRLQMVGYLLAEDDKTLVFAPKYADAMVQSGVHVMDKAETVRRPATPNDALFKVLD